MESETLKIVFEFIRTVGVPAALAFWLLYRTDKRIEDLTKAVRALIAVIKGELPEEGI